MTLYFEWVINQSMNQSIKIYFLSNNKYKNYNIACEHSKGCQRRHMLIKLAA